MSKQETAKNRIEALSNIADGLLLNMRDAHTKAQWAMNKYRTLPVTRDKYVNLAHAYLKELTEVRKQIAEES